MTHTLGPLYIEGPSTGNGPYDDGGDYCIYCLNADGEKEIIGEVFRLIAQDTEAPAKANARLFVTAPDLLEACEAEEESIAINKEYYKQCDLGMSPSEGWEKLTYTDTITAKQRAGKLRKNAIAKVRGKNEETT